jgi:hypothetical protein
MNWFRRLAASPLEVLAVVLIGCAIVVVAGQRGGARDISRGRDEAIGVLLSLRKAQSDLKATQGRFATGFADLRGALAEQGAQVTSSRRAKTDHYSYFLAEGLGPETWRVTAIGNLDADPWPDVVVVQGGDSTVETPVVTSDDVSHRARRYPTSH